MCRCAISTVSMESAGKDRLQHVKNELTSVFYIKALPSYLIKVVRLWFVLANISEVKKIAILKFTFCSTLQMC